MDTNERIEALEQQVASLSSALSVVEDVLGYRVHLLEEKLKSESDQHEEAA